MTAPRGHKSVPTRLELSREAVSLLGWAVDKLGDPFAIGGFHSNTRHDVRYLHIKGYSEPWDDRVKGRLAALQTQYSTRMGAAMRHAAHHLENQKADEYVSDIFGKRYTVIDNIQRLPERLPELFLALTK